MKKLTKVDITTAIIMLSIAFIVDIVEIILTLMAVGMAVEIISGIAQYGIFALWFHFHGCNLFLRTSAPKKNSAGNIEGSKVVEMKISAKQVVSAILESIPVIGSLPFFTASVFSKIIEVNKAVREQESTEGNENIIRMSTNNTERNPNILQFAKNPTPQSQPGSPAKDQNSNVIRLKNENNLKKAA